MFLVEDNNFLSEKSKDYIENVILQNSFPYYYQSSATYNDDNNPYMCHIAIKRPEERDDGEKFNSTYAEPICNFLLEFCNKHNIKINEILRCAVNITYNSPDEYCPIHMDHEYEHKQLLLYINEPIDKNSNLIIYDWDGTTKLKEISPTKFKGVCFEGRPHSIKYPEKGDRIVIVYTFK